MSAKDTSPRPGPAADHSLSGFFGLVIVSGITIGMANIIVQLFAIQLGANPFQIGVIGAMESVGMMLFTIPAGFIISRHGVRLVYMAASLGPLLLYAIFPFFSSWWMIAVARLFVGICIPFRTVSMTSVFLNKLREIGTHKAGWHRGAMTLGSAIIGPAMATYFQPVLGFYGCFLVIALSFGLMTIFSLSFFPDQPTKKQGKEDGFSMLLQIRSLLENRKISESCITEFLNSATGALFSTFIVLVAHSMPGLDVSDGVNVILVMGGVSIAVLFWGARLLPRMNHWNFYGIGAALTIISMLLVAFASTVFSLMLAGILLAFGSSFVRLVNVSMMASLSGQISKASSLYHMAQMSGSVSGSFVGGIIGIYVSINIIFLIYSLIILTAYMVFYFLYVKNI